MFVGVGEGVAEGVGVLVGVSVAVGVCEGVAVALGIGVVVGGIGVGVDRLSVAVTITAMRTLSPELDAGTSSAALPPSPGGISPASFSPTN